MTDQLLITRLVAARRLNWERARAVLDRAERRRWWKPWNCGRRGRLTDAEWEAFEKFTYEVEDLGAALDRALWNQ